MTSRIASLRSADPHLAEIGALIGDEARAAMLLALLDGRELPAAELAFRAGASPQSASAHLAKLVTGGLLAVTAAGRQRLFRIASPEVAHAVEALAVVARPKAVVGLNQSTRLARLRAARSCYDHLAGRLGVAVTEALVDRHILTVSETTFRVTSSGEAFFSELDIDLADVRTRRRAFARVCLDWTERRPHLGGSLGAALFQRFLASSWIARDASERAVRVTEHGRIAFERSFGIGLHQP